MTKTLDRTDALELASDIRHAANIIEAALEGETPRRTARRFVETLRWKADELTTEGGQNRG